MSSGTVSSLRCHSQKTYDYKKYSYRCGNSAALQCRVNSFCSYLLARLVSDKKNISRMTAEYLSEVSKNTPSLLKLAVLVLLVVGCTAYPTSFDSIEVVTKQGDTVIEGVISPDGLLFASPNKNATDIYLWKQATGRFEFSSSLTGHLGEV